MSIGTPVGFGNTAGTASNTAGSCTLPTITTDGVAYLLVGTNTATTLSTPPAGWSLVDGPRDNSAGTQRAWLYSRAVTSADSGATVSVTFAASSRWSLGGFVVPGGDSLGVVQFWADDTVDATLSVPAITPAVDDTYRAILVQPRANSAAYTVAPPAGWTELYEGIAGATGTAARWGVYAAGVQLVGQAGVAQAATSATYSGATARNIGWEFTVRPIPTAVVTRSGSAAGGLAWAGTAAGRAARAGSAVGTLAWAGTATASTTRAGSATGAVAFAGAVEGRAARRGSSVGQLSWAGTTSGQAPTVAPRSGSAAGSLSWAGVATGAAPTVAGRSGAAAGALSWTGVATARTPRRGSGTGNIAWAGTTTGATARRGTISGILSWAGAAAGLAPTVGAMDGSAAGELRWVGVAAARANRHGAASGLLDWTGAAAGQAPTVGAMDGSAAGELRWVGAASATTHRHGEADGLLDWVGVVVAVATSIRRDVTVLSIVPAVRPFSAAEAPRRLLVVEAARALALAEVARPFSPLEAPPRAVTVTEVP